MHSHPPGQILPSNNQNQTRRGHSIKEHPFMEHHTQDEDLKAHLLTTNEQFRTLAEQHARLKKQIEEIESKPLVTGVDELEEQRLKKLKLRLKYQMIDIMAQ